MSGKDLPATGMVITANGGVDGSLTVASTTTLRVGMRGFISSATEAGREIQIVEITSGLVFKAKFVRTLAALGQDNYKLNPCNYGFSDMSAFHILDTARVDFEKQFVYGEPV